LVGPVHSLEHIAVAKHILDKQIIARHSLLSQPNTKHFASCLCIEGDGALYLHM